MGPVRGVALVSVMLIAMMLFLMTLAFLTKQRLQHQATSFQKSDARARALAETGLEDALIKLDKDYNFPPQGGPDQPSFSYTEELTGADGRVAGRYLVKVDQTFHKDPQQILLIQVSGEVGDEAQTQQRASLQAYIDTNPANPTYFKVIQLEWLGGGL